MQILFSRTRMLAIAIVIFALLVSGCKATSTLTVTVGESASGTVSFVLELDEDAASHIRHDAYNQTNLTNIFGTDELKKAGYKISVKENTNGDPSRIEIRASYTGEAELKSALAVFAPEDVIESTLTTQTSLFKENQKVVVTLDPTKLRETYLQNSTVKDAVEQAGIDFSEFETLINEAMSSTQVTVKVSQAGKVKSATVSGSDTKKASVITEHSVVRTRYLLNMAGAVAALCAGGWLIYRTCRTPRLLSSPVLRDRTDEEE